MEHTRSELCMAVAAAAAFLLLGGCDRQEPKSVGQKVDQSATKLANKTGEAATTVAMAADDTAITAKIKTALMAEPGLKSLDINVDTKDGMVTLSGNVGSGELHDRVKQIASTTVGVKGVIDNLMLKTTS
jgi:hyperosmotically inducible periplasmic protein